MSLQVTVDEHPGLAAAAFVTRFDRSLGATSSPDSLQRLLGLEADAPLGRDEQVRVAVRDLLRHGGYKPTGRGKPASEYLVRAAEQGKLGSINLAVDACNAVSLASGLPISVVDADRAEAPFRIAVAEPGASYVFNPTGQSIDLSGLLCLFDGQGPCANAVKDCQRTKTDDETTATLSVVWGVREHEPRLEAAVLWYRHLLSMCGATTEDVELGAGRT